LNNILKDPKEHEVIKFETAKSLVTLGDWNENVVNFFVQNLNNKNPFIKEDIFKTIINSKNIQFTDKVRYGFSFPDLSMLFNLPTCVYLE